MLPSRQVVDPEVSGLAEPPIFVLGGGASRLRQAGVTVTVVPELASAAKAVNAHLLAG